MSPLLSVLSLGINLVAFFFAAYLGLLALLAWRGRQREQGSPSLCFAFVIPAHNEESVIERTVQSVQQVNYPEHLRRVYVVADNCSDTTAEVARRAGAEVFVRSDRTLRGKGYALEFAFERLLADEELDAFVVVDADTLVTRNLLRAFEQRLKHGERAVQAEYAVQNPHASWRTGLLAIALGMFHHTRSLARERLGLSVGLRGNGMCFSRELLKEHPHRAYGLVEDVEYGVAIGRAGVRVAYAEEAQVLGEMVSRGGAAVSQRRRWEEGRLALARQLAPVLIEQGFAQHSLLLLDLGMDLLVPPLSFVVLLAGVGSLLEFASWWQQAALGLGATLTVLSWTSLGLYLLRGMQYSGLGLRAPVLLAFAPAYILWKILILRPLKKNQEWVRTQREVDHER